MASCLLMVLGFFYSWKRVPRRSCSLFLVERNCGLWLGTLQAGNFYSIGAPHTFLSHVPFIIVTTLPSTGWRWRDFTGILAVQEVSVPGGHQAGAMLDT